MALTLTPSLQPYVPGLVHDWMATSPDTLSRTIDGSMVFVDVSGFTAMSERLARQGKVGAEEVTEVIGDTFASLLGEAYAYGGSLLKFGGDALLLFFTGDDHPLRAVTAAHGMRAELRRVGVFATSAGKVTLRMSVGAHTGPFHFFLVGGSHRELVVAGPTASETVAMEAAGSSGQIILSPALAAVLPRANRGRPIGPGALLRSAPPNVPRSEIRDELVDLDLARYVPAGLRQTVQQGDVKAEHRSVTVAFIHYTGFDALIAEAGLYEAAKVLDGLIRDVQRAVDDRQIAFLATDIAPDGGKIILTAGAPTVTGNDEEQMLLALRDIVAAVSGLSLHTGVNRGSVFAGEIGPLYRRTYTVMGDAVNLAARLMARADHGQILATAQVLDGSRTLFETTELEPFVVKGKKRPVQAYAVREPKGSRGAIAEAGLPLVGRDEELAALLAAWGEAERGSGCLVEVSAEPGMGKSRLLEEFLARAGDVTALRADCRLYQSATPYFPFRTLLREVFGLSGLGAPMAAAGLRSLVTEKAPQLESWLALIGTPLDLEIPSSREVRELADEFRKARLEEAVSELVTLVLSEPTVVLVEDTHWMDEPSRDLLARLTASIADRPWLVVLSRRPGDGDLVAADEGRQLRRIDLRPLGVDQATALIDAATEDLPLMRQQVQALAERAQGNPLFLIELLEALRRGENVESLPQSVEGLIQARIDRLAPGDRRRLRELSVLGVSFRSEHVASALAGGASERVTRGLRRLGDFLTLDRTGLIRFRHALIRDAAYEGLPFRHRRELHAQVGESILLEAGDRPRDAAELLAVHFSHAQRWPAAWTYARIAGDEAREVGANVEAARFYGQALTAGARLAEVADADLAAVWRSLGVVLEAAGEFDRAYEALRRATRLSHGAPLAVAEIHEKRALVRYRIGGYRQALRETTVGLKLVAAHRSAEARRIGSSLAALRARIRLQQGHAREAVELARAAARDAKRTGARAALARSYSALDLAYERLGEPEKAVYERQALSIWLELGELRVAAITEMNLGVRAYDDGCWDEAVTRYARAKETLERVGDAAHAGLVAANLGELLVSRGALDQAEVALAEARRALRAAHFSDAAIFTDIQIGRLAVERGRLADAVDVLERAVGEAASLHQPRLVLDASIQLGAALVRGDDPRGALAVLDDAERRAGDESAALRAPLARVRASALMALGRLDEADAELATALPLARRQKLQYEELRLLEARVDLAGHLGRDPDGEEMLEARRLERLLSVSR